MLKNLCLSTLLFCVQPAFAIMLKDEIQGLKSMDFISFFKDLNDPNLYYYMPRSFRVVEDPFIREPLFSASFIGLKTPDLSDGYGQVNVTVEPYLDKELKDRALAEILAINPNATFSPVVTDEAYPEVLLTNGPATFPIAPQYYMSTADTGGLLSSQKSIAIGMNETASKLMMGALQGNNPVPAVIKIKAKAAKTVFKAKITAHMDRVYKKFQGSVCGGYKFWFRACISKVSEELIQNGDVVVDILSDNRPDLTAKAYAIADGIAARIMNPSLAPISGSDGRPSLGVFTVGLSLVEQREFKKEEWTITERDFGFVEDQIAVNVPGICSQYPQLANHVDYNVESICN